MTFFICTLKPPLHRLILATPLSPRVYNLYRASKIVTPPLIIGTVVAVMRSGVPGKLFKINPSSYF